jgi:hypothetical protein
LQRDRRRPGSEWPHPAARATKKSPNAASKRRMVSEPLRALGFGEGHGTRQSCFANSRGEHHRSIKDLSGRLIRGNARRFRIFPATRVRVLHIPSRYVTRGRFQVTWSNAGRDQRCIHDAAPLGSAG